LSKKHGVNPCIVKCFVCQEDTGELALLGHLPNDAEAPREAVLNTEPCPKCQDHMKQGVILISVRNGETGNNPYRTGDWVVIKEEALKRFVQPPSLLTHILKARMAFIDDQTWDFIKLPRPSKEAT